MYVNGAIAKGGSHPPRNKMDVMALIRIILAYSPKKNRAKGIDEYSTLYPETSSASASGKSKGGLLVSANVDIKNNKKNIKHGIIFQIAA